MFDIGKIKVIAETLNLEKVYLTSGIVNILGKAINYKLDNDNKS